MTKGPEGRSRPPTADEAALFARAVGGARPLPGRPPLPPLAAAPMPPAAAARPQAAPAAPPPAAAVPAPAEAGLDRRTAERLRRGRLPIEARLDLHGLHQRAAFQRLASFVLEGHAAGRRCLLVVTGKGAAAGFAAGAAERAERGILRRNVPRWLAEPGLAEKVLAIRPARLEHGGDGALYVLLRRRRDGEGGRERSRWPQTQTDSNIVTRISTR